MYIACRLASVAVDAAVPVTTDTARIVPCVTACVQKVRESVAVLVITSTTRLGTSLHSLLFPFAVKIVYLSFTLLYLLAMQPPFFI